MRCKQVHVSYVQYTGTIVVNISGAVRVGVMIFSTNPQIEFHLNEFSTKADVYAAIDNIPYIYGSTNTADALEMMWSQMYTARNGDRPGIPNTCVIITDGVSVLNQERTIPEARVSLVRVVT